MRFRLPLIAGGGCTDCLNISQLRRPMFAGDHSVIPNLCETAWVVDR
jgi:hypothetical protein